MFSWLPLNPVPWHALTDGDIWWHMRTGEWIVQHHQVPRVDVFSSVSAGRPWVAYSWTFEVLAYELARNWDLTGIVAYEMVMWVIIAVSLLHLLRGILPRFWECAGLALVGGFCLERQTGPRPGVFTILFFLWELDILLRARRSGNKRLLLLVPVVIWMWANVHLQFAYGLVLLGVFCVEPVMDRLFRIRDLAEKKIPAFWMWGALAVSFAVTFANAYGLGEYKLWTDVVRYARVYRYINEMRPMDFTLPVHYVVTILIVTGAIAVGRHRPVRPLWVLLMLWAALSSIRTERDIWLGTIVAVAAIAVALAERERAADQIPSRVWLAAAAGVLLVLTVALKTGPSNRQILASLSSEMPVGAVAFIHEHHLQGPLFNDYDWGGYLIYALPEIPVSIDGRMNAHSPQQVERSLATWNLWTEWETNPQLQQAKLVVAQHQYALTRVLAKDPHFRVLFDDGVGVVFQRIAR